MIVSAVCFTLLIKAQTNPPSSAIATKTIQAFSTNNLGELAVLVPQFEKAHPEHVYTVFFKAYLADVKDNNVNEALRGYSQVIKLSPDIMEAYFFRCRIFYEKGMYEKALEDITNAIKYAELLIDRQINPAQGMSMKAQYLHQAGRFNESVSYLDSILKKYPMTDYLWLTLGDIYKKEGQTDEALNCYLKTRQIKIQKGANMNDKDIQFIDNKIRETKQNAT